LLRVKLDYLENTRVYNLKKKCLILAISYKSIDCSNKNNFLVSMRQMEKTRRAITDQTLKDVQFNVSKLTKSLEIWKNRSKALDVEITALRVQIQKLLSKSEVDNQLIDKLKVIFNIKII